MRRVAFGHFEMRPLMEVAVPPHLILRVFAWLLALPWLAKLFVAARGLPSVPESAQAGV